MTRTSRAQRLAAVATAFDCRAQDEHGRRVAGYYHTQRDRLVSEAQQRTWELAAHKVRQALGVEQ